jgi:serine/threonine protein kinase
MENTLVGTVLDSRYRLDKMIGKGGMGTVYLATHLFLQTPVAIKILHRHWSGDSSVLERFRREARASAQIRHPNIVSVTDYGVTADAGLAYIVMEFLEGIDLRERIKREKQLSYMEALTIVEQTCAAMQAAHNVGIIHRDLKPDNIWLQKGEEGAERVRVLDFGIAKLRNIADTNTLTQTGMVIGTPYYMSPEQCRGENIDNRSDIYSLGVVIYEMLTGRIPFEGANPVQVVLKHNSAPPPPLSAFRPDMPPELERVTLRALAKEPDARQQSAHELAREFREALGILPSVTIESSIAPPILTPSDWGDTMAEMRPSEPFAPTRPTMEAASDLLSGETFMSASKDSAWNYKEDWKRGEYETPSGFLHKFLEWISSIFRVLFRSRAGQQNLRLDDSSQSPEDFGPQLTVHMKASSVMPDNEAPASAATVMLRHAEVFQTKDEHILEELVLHNEYDRLWRSLLYLEGGRYLLTGYGAFGGTSLVRCAIEKARAELKAKGRKEGALLVFYFRITDETKESFKIEADHLGFDHLKKSDDLNFNSDLKELRARAKQTETEALPSIMDLMLHAPLELAFFDAPQKERRENENQNYRFSEFVADLNAFFKKRQNNKALQEIVLRLVRSEHLPSRVVFIIDRVEYLETLEALSRSELTRNSRINIVAVSRKEDFDCWEKVNYRLKAIRFIKWYVSCLWNIDWGKALFNSSSVQLPDFKQRYELFLKHLEYKGRGSLGNIIEELKQPRNTHFGGRFNFINITDMVNRPEVQHNAWVQAVLDKNWKTILGNLFGGRDQDERTDRARIGVYHLIDWVSDNRRFSKSDILEASQSIRITISDEIETSAQAIDNLLFVLTHNEYLEMREAKYRLIWDMENMPRPRRATAKRKHGLSDSKAAKTDQLRSDTVVTGASAAAPEPDAANAMNTIIAEAPPASFSSAESNQGDKAAAPITMEFGQRTQVMSASENLTPPKVSSPGAAAASLNSTAENNQAGNKTGDRQSLRDKVFISYSHADTEWLKRLHRHLKPMEKQGAISLWDDTKIKSGKAWKKEIKKAIDSARVALLFVSPDFLASDFIINNELPPLLAAAEEEGTTIMPLIVSPSRFRQTEVLSNFQAINSPERPLTTMDWNEQEKLFVKITEDIEEALKAPWPPEPAAK